MKVEYVLVAEGLDDLSGLATLSPEIVQAATRAVNAAADFARTKSAEQMRRQVNFPARYLTGADSRLRVIERASPTKISATISGRRRPTSLARFIRGTARPGRRGPVNVEIKPGQLRSLDRAFLMPLRSGGGDLGNVGLAVRTRLGERPKQAYKPMQIGAGLWLLYGPSVDQVFKTVRDDVSPEAIKFLESEFNRLMEIKI